MGDGDRSRFLQLTVIMCVWLLSPFQAPAETTLPAGAVIEVEDPVVREILATFQQADDAIRRRDLNGLMNVYSGHYNYHGLTAKDIRAVWADLFSEYQDISTVHLFSHIAQVGSGSRRTVEVTCTGHLSARSKTSGLVVPIDSWHEEIHYLVHEDGRWRIRGNAGERPSVMPFGTAPHPLF